jgi:hypothetical protein
MKMKKFILSSLLGVALLIPNSVLAADDPQLGPGTWDPKGTDEVFFAPGIIDRSITWESSGGDAQVRVRNVGSTNSYSISLWEYDPDGPDVRVGNLSHTPTGNRDITWNVRDYVDGSTGKAELYVIIGYSSYDDTANLYFYD